ncbi:TPA: hypothetical protein MG645_24120, partial [Klebsiella pneumoniae]|nr:hypothetical protein [Klebsiella pneumoniae]
PRLARDAAGLAAGALRGCRRRAAPVWRRESAGYADIKKMANIAIGPSKRNFIIIIIPGFASRIV